MTYEEATAHRDQIEAAMSVIAARQNAAPKNGVGLTLDSAKTEAWHADRRAYDVFRSKLQRFNRIYVRLYGAEIRAARDASRLNHAA